MSQDQQAADLIAGLKAAKSKPCYFVMLVKGPAVVHLIVSKTPIKEASYKDAKREFAATATLKGICGDEKGEMVFKIATDSPVKDSKLKEFITKTTKLSLSTRFEVKADADVGVESESEESTAEEGDAQVSADSASTSRVVEQQEPAASQDPTEIAELSGKFTLRLKAIKPGIDKVVAAGVVVSGEVKAAANEMITLAGKKEFVKALKVLDHVEGLLKLGLIELAQKANLGKPPPPEQHQDTVESSKTSAAEFTGRLKLVRPQMEKVFQDGGSAAEQVKQLSGEMGAAAKEGDFDLAGQLLDKIASLLTKPSDNKIKVAKGLVKYRKALLKFRDARKVVDSQLAEFRNSIGQSDPDEVETADEIVDWLEDTFWEIDKAIDTAMSTPEEDRQSINEQTNQAVAKFMKELNSDPMVQHIDNNPYANVAIAKMLIPALDEITKTMV